MSKPRIYTKYEKDVILRRLRQKPRYMWFDTIQGPIKIFEPTAVTRPSGEFDIAGKCLVAPRYCGRVSNY
jgi:hypothetical protein